jgi:hypothetical protein
MSEPGPDPLPAGGEVRQRLDRAPAERYADRPATQPPSGEGSEGPGRGAGAGSGTTRGLLAAGGAALCGAALFFGLGLVDIGAGTLAAAAAVGWIVAMTLIWGAGASPSGRRTRMTLAAGLAGGAVALGLLVGWAWARVEGGVLPPLEYLDQRYGPLAWVNVLLAAIIAAWRAR